MRADQPESEAQYDKNGKYRFRYNQKIKQKKAKEASGKLIVFAKSIT